MPLSDDDHNFQPNDDWLTTICIDENENKIDRFCIS